MTQIPNTDENSVYEINAHLKKMWVEYRELDSNINQERYREECMEEMKEKRHYMDDIITEFTKFFQDEYTWDERNDFRAEAQKFKTEIVE